MSSLLKDDYDRQQATDSRPVERLCQYQICRKHAESEPGICRKCLLHKWNKSGLACKGLQRASINFEKVVCVGYMDKGTGKHQSNQVYSILALSPTICASGERMRQYLWILV